MRIEEEKLAPLLEEGFYTCKLLQKPIGAWLTDQFFPLGRAIGFVSPVKINMFEISKCLVISAEIRHTNAFGAISFYRGFVNQMGAILSSITKEHFYTDEGCLFSEQKQVNLNAHNLVKDTFVVHSFFPLEGFPEDFNFKKLELTEEQITFFIEECSKVFSLLLEQIHRECCRDDI